MDKYRLTDEVKILPCGTTVYRILYNDGPYGGWLESECNLSQNGDCMVLDHACSIGNATVTDNAIISDYAMIQDGARVSGSAVVCDFAVVSGTGCIGGNSYVGSNSLITNYVL